MNSDSQLDVSGFTTAISKLWDRDDRAFVGSYLMSRVTGLLQKLSDIEVAGKPLTEELITEFKFVENYISQFANSSSSVDWKTFEQVHNLQKPE